VHLLARTCACEAACTGCGVVSRRVHSRYRRQLADTASGGQEVLIDLQARRFFCKNHGRACRSPRQLCRAGCSAAGRRGPAPGYFP
jgi:transposase